MKHTKTKAPFRYDIVGSFLRPAALMKMREAYAAGNAGAEELRAAEDTAIRDLVAKEKEGTGRKNGPNAAGRCRSSW
mgnify:CR=1 FL=1